MNRCTQRRPSTTSPGRLERRRRKAQSSLKCTLVQDGSHRSLFGKWICAASSQELACVEMRQCFSLARCACGEQDIDSRVWRSLVNSDAVGWVSRAVLRLQVRDPILWAGDAWAIPSAWPASGLRYRPRIGGRRIVHRLASYASAQDGGTARQLNREMVKQFASPAASSSAQLFGKVA